MKKKNVQYISPDLNLAFRQFKKLELECLRADPSRVTGQKVVRLGKDKTPYKVSYTCYFLDNTPESRKNIPSELNKTVKLLYNKYSFQYTVATLNFIQSKKRTR